MNIPSCCKSRVWM